MKKKLIVFGLLLALGLTGLAGAHLAVAGTAEQVTWTTETLLGEPSAAADLKLTMEHNDWGHLKWTSQIDVFGRGSTEFTFSRRFYVKDWQRVQHLEFYYREAGGMYWYSPYCMTEEELWPGSIEQVVWDVGSRAPENGTRTETVRVGDYFDVIVPEVTLELTGDNQDLSTRYMGGMGPEDSLWERLQIVRQLQQAFRFPMPEDHTAEIKVVREDGNIVEYRVENPDNGIQMYVEEVLAGNYLYFYLYTEYSKYDQKGEPEQLDWSLTPGGRAVYRLPTEDRPLSIDDLEVVLPLEPEEEIQTMNADPDGSHVMVVTVKDDRERVCVLNSATGQMELEADCGPCSVEDFGLGGGLMTWKDLALSVNGDRLVLLQERNGAYEVAMTGRIPEEIGSWSGRSSMRYLRAAYDGRRLAAYDGRRLAIGMMLEQRPDGGLSSDLGLLVYDGSEPVYAGELIPSLSRGSYVREGDDPISLSW